MQVPTETDATAHLDRLVDDALPDRRGLAWRSLLRAQASLMRQFDTDLVRETGLGLADFDVLAQLALADGSPRSGMTRRVARLVGEGLVQRTAAETDARNSRHRET
jgi:DNA-binding MarR family transcriptional regulator